MIFSHLQDSRLRGNGLERAIQVLKKGGIVVYPTDTAYGLAVDATNLAAVKKLYRLKGRNFKKPVHVIVPSKQSHGTGRGTIWLKRIIRLNAKAERLLNKFWPGPLTVVLPLTARGKSWQMLSAGTGTLGVRYPRNKIALALVEKFSKPITTTSANVSGKSDNYSISSVKRQFKQSRLLPDFYLDGGRLKKIKPSTVVAIIPLTPGPSPRRERGVLSGSKSNHVKILRPGPISEKQIKQALT